MDDESGESMEPVEEVPLKELGDAELERCRCNDNWIFSGHHRASSTRSVVTILLRRLLHCSRQEKSTGKVSWNVLRSNETALNDVSVHA